MDKHEDLDPREMKQETDETLERTYEEWEDLFGDDPPAKHHRKRRRHKDDEE